MVISCLILLLAFIYYVYFSGEGKFSSSNKKYYLILFAVFIRLLASGFIETDNYTWLDYSLRTIEYGYPRIIDDPIWYSYWSDHNPLKIFVQHPPLAFYLYAPIAYVSDHASNLLNILFFTLSIHVLWNFLERRKVNPLYPTLLYITFPLFYLESASLFSFNILTISVLTVALVNYVEYNESKNKQNLWKTIFCLTAATLIDYTSILLLSFLSVHFLLKNRRNALQVIVILTIIWAPFLLWNLYADFPIFHNFGFTYLQAHHMNDQLSYGEAVREYYSGHANKTLRYYLMDNPLFAVICLILFLNLNLLLIGRNKFHELKYVLLMSIILQLLLLTYYAVIKYQSHPIANYVRYIIPPMFYVIPLSLKNELTSRDKKLAYLITALNLILILYILTANHFQWVTIQWNRTIS